MSDTTIDLDELERLAKVALKAAGNEASQVFLAVDIIALIARVKDAEHERDIAAQRWGEALRAREFSKQWYGVRLQQLRELADAHGLTKEHCNIVANGAVSMCAPPTHAQQLNMAIYRAEKAEEELAMLKLKLKRGEHVDGAKDE